MTSKSRAGRSTGPRGTKALRQRLILKIPDMLDAAIAAYQQIATTSSAEDPKAFSATQSGAKAALVHIEQIIKLAEMTLAEDEKVSSADADSLEALLEMARKAVAAEETTQSEESGP